MRLPLICFVFLNFLHQQVLADNSLNDEQCVSDNKSECGEERENQLFDSARKYGKDSNEIYRKIHKALSEYKPWIPMEHEPTCGLYAEVIKRDLKPYQSNGITRQMITDAAKLGTHYKIYNKTLYREEDCMFPTRCKGVEHFLLKLVNELPDMDIIINTRDWPQVKKVFKTKGPVFSFSKTNEYLDIMYPAWSFWAGGPAISLYPTGIGRWDLLREEITKAAEKTPWAKKKSRGFFRGSRTSDERDALILLSRQNPDLLNAQYTKNQAWKTKKDTLNAEPAKEVDFKHHCKYKYLFNFRGVAASFRLKHLFLCKSLVLHVGDEWNEFFYFALKPWVHYVPVKSYASEQEIENLLNYFQENDDIAQQIAMRGYEFVKIHLRMEDIECYWKKLLTDYKSLLKYTVKEDNSLQVIEPNNI
ncbi:O-glucosyltransferase rumi-like [Teleopsis dalmanni]|uniref:O-glucosyltransferase rumi-like n=1 Tax=Teleopsis dalmanni TaxID=139649 RepID=UPI000D32CA12|nr:O-glucosyltransferase rumi-like [Teleopsis dalmanni]